MHITTCVARTLRGREGDPAKCFLDGQCARTRMREAGAAPRSRRGRPSSLTPAIRLRPRPAPLTFSSLPRPQSCPERMLPAPVLLLRNRVYILIRGHDPASPRSPTPSQSTHVSTPPPVVSFPGPVSSWRASCIIHHLKAHVAHPLTASPRPYCYPQRWAWFSGSPSNFTHLHPPVTCLSGLTSQHPGLSP